MFIWGGGNSEFFNCLLLVLFVVNPAATERERERERESVCVCVCVRNTAQHTHTHSTKLAACAFTNIKGQLVQMRGAHHGHDDDETPTWRGLDFEREMNADVGVVVVVVVVVKGGLG